MFVDFSDVKSAYELIPEGTYAATVTKIEERMSKAGKPYIAWEFVITGGEYDSRHMWLNTSLSSGALWRLKRMLKEAFGVDDEQLHGEFEFDPEAYIGEDVALIVKHEMFNDQERSVVDFVVNKTEAETDAPF